MRQRLAGLGEFRLLTDGEAEALLGPGVSKTVNEAVHWVGLPKAGRRREVRVSLEVFNGAGERLAVGMRVPLALPTRPHLWLVWGDKGHGEQPETIRRLDLRDDHVNPDGEEWRDRTHKHRWSEASNNAWAYTPVDIPHDPDPEFVGPENYRAVFEAFLAECRIDLGLDYKWVDPPLEEPAVDTLWEVP